MANLWLPCDENCVEPIPCGPCNASETPAVIQAVISGFTDDCCNGVAAAINGTHDLNQSGACTWSKGFTGGDIAHATNCSDVWCATNFLSKNVYGVISVIIDTYITLRVDMYYLAGAGTVGQDHIFDDVTFTPGDCCTDLGSPLSLAFNSEAADTGQFSASGSSASVTVQCTS